MLDYTLMRMGWKTPQGKWDKDEILFDFKLIAIFAAIVIGATVLKSKGLV